MSLFLFIGVMLWASSLRKHAERLPKTEKHQPLQSRRQGSRPSHHGAPDAHLSGSTMTKDEAVAVVLLLSLYRGSDSLGQQTILRRMDARIVAQFNHLLNSTWNLDDQGIMDYLAQQSRQGRYPELGAFALRMRR